MDLDTEQNSGASDRDRAFELVHLYVGGDLEPAEERLVEAQLESSEELRTAVAEARRLRQVYFEAAAADGAAADGDVDLWSDLRRTLVAEGILAGDDRAESPGEVTGAATAGLPAASETTEEDDSARVGMRAGGLASVEAESQGGGDREGAIYQGRFKALTAAAAAVLLTLVGAQFLFGPENGAGLSGAGSNDVVSNGAGSGAVGALGVRDASLANYRGEAEVATPAAAGAAAEQAPAGALLANSTQAPGGMRPIGADQRLIQPDGEVTIVVPVRGFPLQGSSGAQQSLATSIR